MTSLMKIIGVIDNMTDLPELGQEFLKESRKFWAAKKDIFDSKDNCHETRKLYPGMASFKNIADFQEHYGRRFGGYILSVGMNSKISNMGRYLIKEVSKKFREIEPYDNTILPVMEEMYNGKIKATIILPTDEKFSLFYYEE